jgi:YidC/Oxa1 family membrane protein insertase
MFSYIWHTFFFDPIYNLLTFFVDVFPNGDLGLAIIATVIVIKVILYPLSIKAIKTQKIMREIEPKLKQIKIDHKDNREAQSRAMLELYREAGLNPFASIAVLFIQIPVIFALGIIAVSGSAGIKLPQFNPEILYSFVPMPDTVSMLFLGQFDIAAQSLLLALLAGATQFVSVSLSLPKLAPKEAGAEPDMKADFMRNMQLQMKYVMPVMMVFIAYAFSAAIALYFVVSNIAQIIQELLVRKHR